MLFVAWTGKLHRPTKDLDLLGWGSPDLEEVQSTIRTICAMECDDGLLFELHRIEAERIREDAEYEGIRVWAPAGLDRAKV